MARTQEPDIWLQGDDGEAIGVADCGCRLVQNYQGSGAAFFFCNTHASALALLTALEVAIKAAICPCCGRDNSAYPDGCDSDDCPGVVALVGATKP